MRALKIASAIIVFVLGWTSVVAQGPGGRGGNNQAVDPDSPVVSFGATPKEALLLGEKRAGRRDPAARFFGFLRKAGFTLRAPAVELRSPFGRGR